MKSSHKNAPLSGVFSVFAVGLVAIVGFFTIGSSLPRQQTQEEVLGTTVSRVSVASFPLGNKYYKCKAIVCNDKYNVKGSATCTPFKDNSGQSVCKWLNTSKAKEGICLASDAYSKGTSTKARIYQQFSKTHNPNAQWMNQVVYNCVLLTPTPTKKAPSNIR